MISVVSFYGINCALLSAMKSKPNPNVTRMRGKPGVNLVPLSPESSPFRIRLHGKLILAEQSLLQSYEKFDKDSEVE